MLKGEASSWGDVLACNDPQGGYGARGNVLAHSDPQGEAQHSIA